MLVEAWLTRAAAARPDRTALHTPGGACSYAELLASVPQYRYLLAADDELDDGVERACAWFRSRGVESIEPFSMAEEDVTFRLPVELRPDRLRCHQSRHWIVCRLANGCFKVCNVSRARTSVSQRRAQTENRND